MPVSAPPGRWITLVTDNATPNDQKAYGGYRIFWPDSAPPLPATVDSINFGDITLYGYARNNGTEWMIQPQPDPNKVAIDAIPGPGGWVSTQARQVYYDQGLYLLGLGLPGPDLRAGSRKYYEAAIAEYQARIAAGLIAPILPK